MHRLLPLFVLIAQGCATPDGYERVVPSSDGVQVLPTEQSPVPTLTLTGPASVDPGTDATFTVSGTRAGMSVLFGLGLGGEGGGPCPARIGGQCLSIVGPIRQLGPVPESGGQADLVLSIPSALGARTAAIQAVVIRGPGGANSLVSNVLSFQVNGEISGCTDPAADNYDPSATTDDGSCYYSGDLLGVSEFYPSDFDVSADGTVVVVGYAGDTVYAKCFRPDGSVLKPAFALATYSPVDWSTPYPKVARARDTGDTAVTWHLYNSEWWIEGYDWRPYREHLDAACDVVAGPVLLEPATPGILRYAEVRISDDGLSAFVYEDQSGGAYRLVLVDRFGALINAVTVGQGTCGGGAIGRSLGMNPATGDTVVGCEPPSLGASRYFQRFDSTGAPIDPAMVEVPTAISPMWGEFQGAMNRDGYLVFASRNWDTGEGTASFYAPSGTLLSTSSFSSYSAAEERIIVLADGTFVLTGSSGAKQIFAADGTWLRTDTHGWMVRVDGADRVFVLDSQGVSLMPWSL